MITQQTVKSIRIAVPSKEYWQGAHLVRMATPDVTEVNGAYLLHFTVDGATHSVPITPDTTNAKDMIKKVIDAYHAYKPIPPSAPKKHK